MQNIFNVDFKDGLVLIGHNSCPVRLCLNKCSLKYNVKTDNTENFNLIQTDCNENELKLVADKSDVSLKMSIMKDGELFVSSELRNNSSEKIKLDKLKLHFEDVSLGNNNSSLSFFKNGYQSWTTTRSYKPDQKEMVPLPEYAKRMQDNLNNISTGKRGAFNSELFAVVGNKKENTYLLMGQTSNFKQFFCIKVDFAQKNDGNFAMELVFDFGMKEIDSNSSLVLDDFVIMADQHPNRLQDSYMELIKTDKAEKAKLPTGWCSWYYYYTKVGQKEIFENLETARKHNVNWSTFLLDDGYQTALGDWLSINKKFPDGLSVVADEVKAKGMTPGIWLAPFSGRRNSRLYKEHPEWTLKNSDGTPVSAGWNPFWGIGGVFYGFDVTHPGFQEYLTNVIKTLVHEWGFKYLKLDFIYSASLPGISYDPSLSSAERLALGLQLVRDAAGEDVFLLGCGSPLSPAIGMVDGMRIGPDVSPYWFATYRYHLTRDPHSLCTKFAIRSILNRCQMHRKLWINDPDCLMIRDSDTKLSEDERMSLTNAIIISGGMYVLSDKLSALGDSIWKNLDKIDKIVRICDKGRTWALDYMEREMPELAYNSSGYLAVFNFSEKAVNKTLNIKQYLESEIDSKTEFVDVWSGESFVLDKWNLSLGEFKPHSSRLLAIKK